MTPETSSRISFLRFPLIVGVVLIHAYGVNMVFSGRMIGMADSPDAILFIQNLISQVIARTCVPLFFTISGLLFFSGTPKPYGEKLKSRVRTLLVPYLFWNALMLAFFYTLQSMPGLAEFFSGRKEAVTQYEPLDFLNAFVGLGTRGPIADQFWFIRDLMIMSILSPIVGFVAKRAPRLGLLACAAAWIFNKRGKLFYLLNVNAFCFFYFGAVMAIQGWDLQRADRYRKWILAAFVPLAVIDAALMTKYWPGGIDRTPSHPAHLVVVLLGMACVWVLAGQGQRMPRLRNAMLALGPYAFFVFAAHEPLQGGLKKLLYKALHPDGTVELTLVYLLAPMMAIALTLAAGYVFRRCWPQGYDFVTGGRAESMARPPAPGASASTGQAVPG